jgi:hypothetical protein
MFVGRHEFVIEEELPLCMKKFAMTMRHKSVIGALSTEIFGSKFLEGSWELARWWRFVFTKRISWSVTDFTKIRNMATKMTGRFAPSMLRLVPKVQVQRP